MTTKMLTCIECPMGCEIKLSLDGMVLKEVIGNTCPRGKMYAEAEITCPKRVVTSTVRAENGKMIAVKTDKPVRKECIFEVMAKINKVVCSSSVKLGDIIIESILDDANLIVADNLL